MKYVVIVGDGMPDYGRRELGGQTPLHYARKPFMDQLASNGVLGLVKTVPEGCQPGSDVANLSILGYDPVKYYTGRSPFEAISMGIELGEEDVAFRCNFVTLSDDESFVEKQMLDYSAGEISTQEAKILIGELAKELASEQLSFFPGISYRHLMIWKKGPDNLQLTPPHDIHNQKIKDYLPRGEGASVLLKLMEKSNTILPFSAVNINRKKKGNKVANSIWLWGQGKKPSLVPFTEKYGLKGAVISAVDLIKGMGLCIGLEVIDVEGATGNLHTNYRGKAEEALAALERGNDFVFIHIEAPDEAGHQGNVRDKVEAIEKIDEYVLGTLKRGLDRYSDYKVMVLADHYTPVSLRTHTSEEVPFFIYQKSKPGKGNSFHELTAKAAGMYIEEGFRLMDFFCLTNNTR